MSSGSEVYFSYVGDPDELSRFMFVRHYPSNPTENYIKEIRERIGLEFGLSSSCEFQLIEHTSHGEVACSFRNLKGGVYELRLTKSIARIPRLTSPDTVAISLSGTGVVTKRGSQLLLQVILRVSCSPDAGLQQTKITVRLETHTLDFLEKSPENETRTLAVTARSGWEGLVTGGVKGTSAGELTGAIKYSHTQETREILPAWRTVTREVTNSQSDRHLLNWMYFKESDDIAVACKGCEWDVEFVKEAGRLTRDAQATHSLTKVYSADIDITEYIGSHAMADVRLPVTITCYIQQPPVGRRLWPACWPQVKSTKAVYFLVSMKVTAPPTLRLEIDSTCLGTVLPLPRRVKQRGQRDRAGALSLYTKDELMELPELTLENIKGAKRSIKINLGVMPKLRKLILKDCRNLGGLEIELGEEKSHDLEDLELTGCWSLLPATTKGLHHLTKLKTITLVHCRGFGQPSTDAEIQGVLCLWTKNFKDWKCSRNSQGNEDRTLIFTKIEPKPLSQSSEDQQAD